eukprot:TRINITY_DN95691_c0_g1_i1.p1 TRINITY_DN95691_c0_g1~~TRINITY_DN95691_c0_g1_i1.p1  ORF type:complete len:122 (-),score=3.72 TRINITY_DN95691_c0_g1_i1:363-728(-)
MLRLSGALHRRCAGDLLKLIDPKITPSRIVQRPGSRVTVLENTPLGPQHVIGQLVNGNNIPEIEEFYDVYENEIQGALVHFRDNPSYYKFWESAVGVIHCNNCSCFWKEFIPPQQQSESDK